MDKESIILRQEVDCNCNDCGFFVRSLGKLNASKKEHRRWVFFGIRTRRGFFWEEAQKELSAANKAKTPEDRARKLVRYNGLLKERSRVAVDKSYKAGLAFGDCSKFNKSITVVPGVCQPDTQGCFVHRRRSPSQ